MSLETAAKKLYVLLDQPRPCFQGVEYLLSACSKGWIALRSVSLKVHVSDMCFRMFHLQYFMAAQHIG